MMKADDHYIEGKKVIHAKTGKATTIKKGMTPVVVHKGEIIVTGKDVARVKKLLGKK